MLKSWAVPKGPSLDPADKRLAMQTEDHPVEYGDFEGIIPEGQYGGGTVLLWDRGTWEPLEDPHQGLRKGALKFRLDGEKLKGKWTLVKIKGRDPRDDAKTWLLIKERDELVRSSKVHDITEGAAGERGHRPDAGARSRRDRDRVWNSSRGESGESADSGEVRGRSPRAAREREAAGAAARPAARESRDLVKAAAAIPGARKAALPATVEAQLATLVDEPPEGDEWLHEMKFDGYRILARARRTAGRACSAGTGRTGPRTSPPSPRRWRRSPCATALLDGEVAVVLPERHHELPGAAERAQPPRTRASSPTSLFDLVHLDGRSPWPARRSRSARRCSRTCCGAPSPESPLRYSDHVAGSGPEFYAQACTLGVEGIVSKRRDAPYDAGPAKSWLKVKCHQRQEFVIGGYTDPEGARVGPRRAAPRRPRRGRQPSSSRARSAPVSPTRRSRTCSAAWPRSRSRAPRSSRRGSRA